MRVALVIPALVLLFAASPALADDPAFCAALVGDDQAHADHHDRRLRVIADVEERPGVVVITHQLALDAPRVLTTDDVVLEHTEVGEDAVLVLGEAFDGLCDEAHAAVHTDDALGEDWQVAYVGLQGLLLLRRTEPELAWLSVDEEEPPEFELVWRSSFSLVQPPTQKAKKKRRKKRRRRRRRRR